MIDMELKLLLETDVFSHCGTDPAAAFLHRLGEKHDIVETGLIVGSNGHQTVLARRELSGQIDYLNKP